MRKHDEGYALVLVLVVLIVLSLLSAAVLTDSLKNLQAQENAVQRMADSYKAEGEIQKLVAQMKAQGQFLALDTEPVAIKVLTDNNSEAPKIRLVAHIENVQVKCVLEFDGAKLEEQPDGNFLITEIIDVTCTEYESSVVVKEGDSE